LICIDRLRGCAREMLEQREHEGSLKSVTLTIDRTTKAVVFQRHIGDWQWDWEVAHLAPGKTHLRISIERL
jgi:hypothetical protein